MQQTRPFRRWLATNQDATSFTSLVATITEPSGDGVLNLADYGIDVPEFLKFMVLLLGADNDVASVRITGWIKVLKDGSTTLWVPTIIGEYSCTASAFVGVAGSAVLATERFADTVSPVAARTRDQKIAAGTSVNSEYEILSPANDTPAHVIMPISAFEKIQLTSDQTTNTPTVNVIYALLEKE